MTHLTIEGQRKLCQQFWHYVDEMYFIDGDWIDEQHGEEFSAWWGNCTGLNIAAAMLCGHSVGDIVVAGSEDWTGTALAKRASHLVGHDFTMAGGMRYDLWAFAYCREFPPVLLHDDPLVGACLPLKSLHIRPVDGEWTFWTDYAAKVIADFMEQAADLMERV